MFMSIVAPEMDAPVYPELAGARVLITGLTSRNGVDLARAFADHKARLVVQSAEQSPAITELAAVLAESATELKLFNDALESPEEAVQLAQGAARDLGGLDVVINILSIGEDEIEADASPTDVEAHISAKLIAAALVTRVTANRMRLTWSQGLILNLVATPPAAAHETVLAQLTQATLAAMTRGEAQEWAEHGIRINAAAQTGSGTGAGASEADLAALALYLASRKGKGLSGHMLDAAGMATSRCRG